MPEKGIENELENVDKIRMPDFSSFSERSPKYNYPKSSFAYHISASIKSFDVYLILSKESKSPRRFIFNFIKGIKDIEVKK